MTAVIADPGTCLPHFPDGQIIAPPDIPESEWLNLRRQGVGGSDIAALLGLDKYRDSLQVYLEKRGHARAIDPKLDRAARRGKRLESLAAELFAEETGYLVVGPPGTLAHRSQPWMRVNLDGMAFDPDPAVTEYKSRTWRSGKAENWAGDTPPDGPTVQACWGMACTGWKRAYVAGLVDDDFHWFRIERDEELIGNLVTVARRFWFEHVLPGRPPAPSGLKSTTALLQSLWDVKPGATKIVDPAEVTPLIRQRRQLKQEIAAKEKRLRELESQMKMLLGDAEQLIAPNGDTQLSWAPDGAVSEKRLREQLPATYEAYLRPGRVFDLAAFKSEQPHAYAAYRARSLKDGKIP